MGVPLLIHQPRYSMFDRTPEQSLFDTLGMEGIGSIVFSPLAQGMLTDRYLSGSAPKGSRAARNHFLKTTQIDPAYLERANGLNNIAGARGQSLAQLALTWVLRHLGLDWRQQREAARAELCRSQRPDSLHG
jgi:L-glyceraldehyde 3-phosphate reductase